MLSNNHAKKNNVDKKSLTPSTIKNKSASHVSQQKIATLSIKIPNLNHQTLLTLLHTAIATHQHYPDSAMFNNESGEVTIQFMLYPNGTVQAIQVTQSSGYADLDAAAVQAIHEATPFQAVSQYLKRANRFDIHIIFQ